MSTSLDEDRAIEQNVDALLDEAEAIAAPLSTLATDTNARADTEPVTNPRRFQGTNKY